MERNVLVDRLKGYACFLVLLGHVIMGIRLAGIDIPEFFWGMEKFIWSFHVALFLFLSGVVYKMTGEWKGRIDRMKNSKLAKFTNGFTNFMFFAGIVMMIKNPKLLAHWPFPCSITKPPNKNLSNII